MSMDFFDLWRMAAQQEAIDALRTGLRAERVSSSTMIARQAEIIGLMQQEQKELRLRLGVLIRLLIQQGNITAEQFALAMEEAKMNLDRATIPPPPAKATAVRPPTPRPKPPKKFTPPSAP